MSVFKLALFFVLLAFAAPARAQLPRLVLQSGHAGDADSIAVSDDGKLALSVGRNVVLWNVESRRQLRSWTQSGADFKAAQFVPNEKKRALRDGGYGWRSGALGCGNGRLGARLRAAQRRF